MDSNSFVRSSQNESRLLMLLILCQTAFVAVISRKHLALVDTSGYRNVERCA